MKLRKLIALGSALVLALTSLSIFVFTSGVEAAGTTLYWCEFSSNSNWNTASNWNTNSDCSSGTQEVPVSGDALVFNNSTMSSSLDLTNDIPGLDISSITLEGNGTGAYILSGSNAISLDGGITDTISTNQSDSISMNISLTGNQTFTNAQASDDLTINNPISLGSASLTLATSNNRLSINSTISGSGTLTLSSPSSGNAAYYPLVGADTSFTGPVVIQPGAIAEDSSNTFNAFGSGQITVSNGGVLLINSTSTTGTLANNLALAGSGISGSGLYAITSCLDDSISCTGANTTLTLSGKVTLSANTVLVNGAYTVGEGSPPTNNALFDFTSSGLYSGHTLTGLPSSNTTVIDPTPIVVSSGSSSSTSNVKAPDTGQGLQSVDKYTPFIGAALIAGALVTASIALSRRFSNSSSNKK